jgi:hypothetical protein
VGSDVLPEIEPPPRPIRSPLVVAADLVALIISVPFLSFAWIFMT